MFDDPVFWSSLGNNLVWTLIFLTVPVVMALAMAVALLVAPKGRLFVQCIIFLPRILAVAVIGRIFQSMIFSPVTGVVAWLNEHGFSIADPLAVNKRPRLTPPSLDRSKAWLANRRRDPTPINTIHCGSVEAWEIKTCVERRGNDTPSALGEGQRLGS
jgi:raffinose/stachyose/melibiose transport system permease protein